MNKTVVFIKRKLSETKNQLIINKYLLSGKIPWKEGYHQYKARYLESVLNGPKIHAFKNGKLSSGYGYRLDERVVEYPWLFSKLNRSEKCILDAGSSLNHIHIINSPVMKDKKLYITTLDYEGQHRSKIPISYIYQDLRSTCFKDNFFDAICSISTVEHIGMDNTFLFTKDRSKKENIKYAYLTAIREFSRILKKNGTCYITFPFGKYKNHKWFQVFDYGMVRRLIKIFNPAKYEIDFFKYENDQWNFSDEKKCRDGYCFDINVSKKYEKDYLAFSRCVACLMLIK